MKRILFVILAAVFVAGIAVPVYAKTQVKKADVKSEVIYGEITSVNVAKKMIVIKEAEKGKAKTFIVSKKAITQVKVGNKVQVKVKPGSSEAESVMVITDKTRR